VVRSRGRAILWAFPLAALALLLGTVAVTQTGEEQAGGGPTTTTRAPSPPPTPSSTTIPARTLDADEVVALLRSPYQAFAVTRDGVVHTFETTSSRLVDRLPVAFDDIEPTGRATLSRSHRLLFVEAISPSTVQRSFPASTYQAGVWSLDLETGATELVAEDASHPQVSPDGEQLAYSTPGAAVVLDLGTGDVRRWTHPTSSYGEVQGAAWSGDGEALLVASLADVSPDEVAATGDGVWPAIHRLDLGGDAVAVEDGVPVPTTSRNMPTSYVIQRPSRLVPLAERGGHLVLLEEQPVSRTLAQGIVELDLATGALVLITDRGAAYPVGPTWVPLPAYGDDDGLRWEPSPDRWTTMSLADSPEVSVTW
jgi:hypothetical protein